MYSAYIHARYCLAAVLNTLAKLVSRCRYYYYINSSSIMYNVNPRRVVINTLPELPFRCFRVDF